jgi:hypothetical protein
VRYLGEVFAIGALHRGRSIEQFLGRAGDSGTLGIRWVEIVPCGEGYRVVVHASRDVGGEHFRDLVEFPPLNDSDEEDFGEEVAVTAGARDALDAAHAGAGAVIDRWVNQGIAQDEYLDYVRAGRPRTVPPEG